MSGRILIADDEKGIRAALGQLLEYEGYDVRSVGNAVDAMAEYARWRPDLVFLDVKMGGIDGLEALKRIREGDGSAVVVMISGHGTIQTAVEATQLGAYDFLEKPLDTDRVLLTVRNALQTANLREENSRLRESIESRYEIVGKSFAVRALNGTGKELVARAIHRLSGRKGSAAGFVEVNCAAIPSELIESELFGHVKGSFTGAVADRAGKFEQADGGTLFLDEIADMSLSAQAKVLRVLEDGVVTRIGGAKPVSVDVRVIAATNKNLEAEIAEGRFREDLYYRLNVVPIAVPALRERREDIPLLAAHFAALLSSREGMMPRSLGADAVERLTAFDWPGNVRELRNTVERLLILAPGNTITVADVERLVGQRAAEQASIGSLADCGTFEEFKDAAERSFLLSKLRENEWNVSETARILDMPRSNLYKKIERYGLTRERA
jgi:two-component system nitrogen regulation response regulator NtrX